MNSLCFFILIFIILLKMTILQIIYERMDIFMLTDFEKSTLKNELLNIKIQATTQEEITSPKESIKETTGELSMYDNHPADMGTALYEKEKDFTLHEHAESTLAKVEIALLAMKEGTYGKCEVCSTDIPFERLQIVPFSTFCVEHAEVVEQSVQDDVAINEVENPFESTMDSTAIDYENSFQEVAEFGTSDSPSDFTNSEKPTYFDEDDNVEESPIDEIIGTSVTDDNNHS